MKINFVIPCLLGVEGIISQELKSLGAENITTENGRVLFSGDEYMLARVNICSHFAQRLEFLSVLSKPNPLKSFLSEQKLCRGRNG
ncbi:MAG TPA: THUMP domain-containing protein [Clostridiales bacterium]|nr:THUMP domain-containing protein [Clostridiales bacterium]